MTTPASEGNRQLVRGAAWMIGMRWIMRAMGLVSTVIVARLLSPDDYGVVAIALIAVGLLETIAYLGVDLSLIKDQNAGPEEFNSAWTIQLLQGFMIAALLLAMAPLAATYFKEPRAAGAIAWLAVRPIIEGLQNIGLVTFRRDLDFAREFRFNLISKVAGVCIQIGAAFYFRSYWSLVTGMVAAAVISTAMSYLMHPYRPRLTLKKARQIWSFSQWLLISRVGSFFNRRADEFVVGRVNGTSAMGGYHVVYEIATMPTTEIIMPMRRALYPALSKIATDEHAYRRMVTDSLRASAVICVGLGVGLACMADLVVPLVLGEKWLGTVAVMRWLALFSVSAAISSVLEVPLWVAGRTHLSAIANWLELAFVLPILFFATKTWGVEGAAAGRFVVSLVMVPVTCLMVRRACGMGFGVLVQALLRPVAAGAVMALTLTLIPAPAVLPLMVLLLVKCLAGALAYASALWILWRCAGRPDGFEASVFERLRRLCSSAARHQPIG